MLQHIIVSLVTDVKCTSSNNTVITRSTTRFHLVMFVSIDGEDTPQRVPVGTVGKEFANVDWIHHNRTGYLTTFVDGSVNTANVMAWQLLDPNHACDGLVEIGTFCLRLG